MDIAKVMKSRQPHSSISSVFLLTDVKQSILSMHILNEYIPDPRLIATGEIPGIGKLIVEPGKHAVASSHPNCSPAINELIEYFRCINLS